MGEISAERSQIMKGLKRAEELKKFRKNSTENKKEKPEVEVYPPTSIVELSSEEVRAAAKLVANGYKEDEKSN